MTPSMNWRQQISAVGPNKVAKAMNVKYPTVYKYIKPGSVALPRGKSKDLCDAMEVFLSRREHKAFVQSLSLEMTGLV